MGWSLEASSMGSTLATAPGEERRNNNNKNKKGFDTEHGFT